MTQTQQRLMGVIKSHYYTELLRYGLQEPL